MGGQICALIDNISDSALDSVSLIDANLKFADFSDSLLVDINLIGADVSNAKFFGVSADSTALIVESEEWPYSKRVDGNYALGYLRYKGAHTDTVSDYFVYANHPRFNIADKIITNLSKQAQRQRRGLEQRGAARADVPFARDFVSHLLNKNLVSVPKNRKDIIEPTEHGRQMFQEFVTNNVLSPELVEFFEFRY